MNDGKTSVNTAAETNGSTSYSEQWSLHPGETLRRKRGLSAKEQQARRGDGKLCKNKQLLFIPDRLAIAMQEKEWIVRNDNVWVKPNLIPDQVADRSCMSHEYVFHFVMQRFYYYNR